MRRIGHGFFRSRCEREVQRAKTAGTADQGSTGAAFTRGKWGQDAETDRVSAGPRATSAARWRLTLWPQATYGRFSCAIHALDLRRDSPRMIRAG